MVRMIPLVAEEACFALKGGTAINFFVRDLQRMSIDIDLTYLPIEERTASLDGLAAALDRIADRITRLHPEVRVHRATRPNTTRTVKLVVQGQAAQVKIEPNEVTRGVIFPSKVRNLSPKAEALFEMAAAINTVSLPELYAGKLCCSQQTLGFGPLHPRLHVSYDLLGNRFGSEPGNQAIWKSGLFPYGLNLEENTTSKKFGRGIIVANFRPPDIAPVKMSAFGSIGRGGD